MVSCYFIEEIFFKQNISLTSSGNRVWRRHTGSGEPQKDDAQWYAGLCLNLCCKDFAHLNMEDLHAISLNVASNYLNIIIWMWQVWQWHVFASPIFDLGEGWAVCLVPKTVRDQLTASWNASLCNQLTVTHFRPMSVCAHTELNSKGSPASVMSDLPNKVCPK